MDSIPKIRPDITLQRFNSHAEQELETLRYWRDRDTRERFAVVTELLQSYASMHRIDIDAQGPKRTVVRFQRARS